MRDMPFTAVVLGGDMNCYGVARTFYEAYETGTVMAGKTPIFPTAESGIVTGYYDRDIMEDDVLLRLLTEIQRDYPDKKKILLGSNDDYVRHIIHNRKAIEDISADYIIPMISEELFDKLDDKDSFYEMCEEYGLPYPKSVVFDCVNDDPATFDIPFGFPVFAKPASNVIYFDFEFEGKQKGYRIDSREEFVGVMGNIQAAGYPDRFIVQEYIDGDDDSMYIYSAYCDKSGKVRMMSGGHIMMHDRTPELIGNYNAITGAADRGLMDRLRDFLEKIGFTGICHFDIQYDAARQDYVVFEINIRQGRSNYYMTASGMNYAKLLVEDYVTGGLGEQSGSYDVAEEPFIVSNVTRPNLMRAVGRERVVAVPEDRFFMFQLASYDKNFRNLMQMVRIEHNIMKNYFKYK